MKSPTSLQHPQSFLQRLLENGIFWMVLVLLSIGAITTHYHQDAAAVKTASETIPQLPVHSASTSQMSAALTFEVSGNEESLVQVLDILDDHQVKATFFVNGDWVKKHPESIRSIASQGHEIGSTGKDGKPMKGRSEQEILKDMQETANQIQALTGQTLTCLRPPAGEYSDALLKAAQSQQVRVILWNVDSADWKDYGAETIAHTVLDHPDLGKGAILRFHTDAKDTPAALPAIINGLKAKGYSLSTLSEFINPVL